jgi:glycosyltransferase involved in cell wall biosynthesis
MDRPLISFMLFAYNQEHYIRRAVEAAMAQTYSPLEIILSDDASSDGTAAPIRFASTAIRKISASAAMSTA